VQMSITHTEFLFWCTVKQMIPIITHSHREFTVYKPTYSAHLCKHTIR
jgi:hypothetical protein